MDSSGKLRDPAAQARNTHRHATTATAVVGAAISALLKALGPVVDPVLEAWAASKGLGANVKALKTELLYVQVVLEDNLGREIRNNSALEQLLWNLQDLAYDAEDVLDELDYFRIQDELHGTVDAVDEHPNGCCCNHVFHVIHTAKDVGRKIGKAACTSAAATPSTRLRAHNAITSSPQADGDRGEFKRCMPKITAGPRKITRAVGLLFKLYILLTSGFSLYLHTVLSCQ